jgi:predicted Fe-S protein YdhL (DUF1289 family)
MDRETGYVDAPLCWWCEGAPATDREDQLCFGCRRERAEALMDRDDEDAWSGGFAENQ